jgi:ElaB/YqjD/DUF883 family membrane-anchored ribosome-binding protein
LIWHIACIGIQKFMDQTTTATSDAVIDDVNRLKEDVAKLAADVKAHGRARVDEAKQRVTDTIAATQAQLAARPFAILGFGLLLGFLFGRRSRRRRID